MTEYEAASLALQQVAVWVAATVGAAQCSLIGVGLYIMRRAAIQRDAMHQETMKALDSRHRETMEALNAQREAQSEQHRETMAQHRETMAALQDQREEQNAQREALRELIRRTSA